MSIIAWNCRGLGNPRTIQELRDFVRSKSPQLVFLCETKCKSPVIDKIKQSLNFHGFSVDARGRSGGLALLWHKDIPVSLRNYLDRFIDVDVELSGQAFRLTDIYGEPNVQLQRQSWNHLRNLASNPESPWLICGDFNEVLTQAEFQGSHRRASWQMNLFRDTLSHLNMFDLGFEGPQFTWSRLLVAPHTQRARLDRAICNSLWHDFFPWTRVNHCSTFFSDHSLLHIQVQNRNPHLFEITDVEYSALRPLKLDLLLDQLDIKWKQRAKQHWYKEGDRNTQFFHAFASKRKSNNHISQLKDPSGILRDSPSDLERIITNHLTLSSPPASPTIMTSPRQLLGSLQGSLQA
ncbi:hypothetical protein DH2020_003786 [Rehmannia glutinosa]|uniref:Endonuclease/exonuclease/phosphatase domain-containing protein n=1 Tax=Rehmannia glutinosa TaxID=99300 RepID=A0ABR0XMM8_REHGL